MRELLLGIDEATIENGVMLVFCGSNGGESYVWGQSVCQIFYEESSVFFEFKADGATENDMIGSERGYSVRYADRETTGDLLPIGAGGEVVGEFSEVLRDGAGGSEMLPFSMLAIKIIFDVTGFISSTFG